MTKAINTLAMQQLLQADARRSDVRIQWIETNGVPKTDGKTVYIPKLNSNTTEMDVLKLRNAIRHEGDHVKRSDMEYWRCIGASPEELLGFVWNLTEDNRIDRYGSQEYKGDTIVAAQTYLSQMTTIAQKLAVNPQPEWEPVKALLAWDAHTKVDYMSQAVLVEDMYKQLLTGDSKKWYDMLVRDYAIRMMQAKDGKPGTVYTHELSRDIIANVFGQNPDEQQQQAGGGSGGEQQQEQVPKNQKGKQDGQDQGGSGNERGEDGDGSDEDGSGQSDGADSDGEQQDQGDESSGSKAGSGKGQSEGQQPGESGTDQGSSGEASNESDGPRVPRAKHVTAPYRELQPMSGHSDKGFDTQGLHLDYTNYNRYERPYVPCTPEEVTNVDFVHGERVTGLGEGHITDRLQTYEFHDYHQYFKKDLDRVEANVGHLARSLGSKVRMLLQIRSKARVSHGQKRGKLDARSLNRIIVKDAREYSSKVFKTVTDSDTLDTCVTVLIDNSGSMNGPKSNNAIIAAKVLNEVLGNILHLPIELLGFTTWGSDQMNFIYRDFATKQLTEDKLERSMFKGQSMASSNLDGEALLFAYNRIRPRKEKRKLLIVLSDGSPAGRNGIPEYTEAVADMIQKENVVEIVGIGIMDENVRRLYAKNHVIYKPEELERALMTVIEKRIL